MPLSKVSLLLAEITAICAQTFAQVFHNRCEFLLRRTAGDFYPKIGQGQAADLKDLVP